MQNTFWTALGTSLTAALVTSLGIYTIRRFAGWGQPNTAYFMCFAAGVLIAASFLHIIPKSFAMNPRGADLAAGRILGVAPAQSLSDGLRLRA